MESCLEKLIDNIFKDVPKTEHMLVMINRIKSKANTKYTELRQKGYARTISLQEVEIWIQKAKMVVDAELAKLKPQTETEAQADDAPPAPEQRVENRAKSRRKPAAEPAPVQPEPQAEDLSEYDAQYNTDSPYYEPAQEVGADENADIQSVDAQSVENTTYEDVPVQSAEDEQTQPAEALDQDGQAQAAESVDQPEVNSARKQGCHSLSKKDKTGGIVLFIVAVGLAFIVAGIMFGLFS